MRNKKEHTLENKNEYINLYCIASSFLAMVINDKQTTPLDSCSSAGVCIVWHHWCWVMHSLLTAGRWKG